MYFSAGMFFKTIYSVRRHFSVQPRAHFSYPLSFVYFIIGDMRKTRKRSRRPDNDEIDDLVVEYAGEKSTLPGESAQLLRAKEFLDQDVLDFFIAQRARDCVEVYTFELCNTSFYRRLITARALPRMSNVPDHVNQALVRVNYLDTQHLHPRFFSSSYVFIPVNLFDNHWVLAVVYHRNGTASGMIATIIIFDSLRSAASGAAHVQIANNIRDFMNCHWCLRHQFGVINPGRVYTDESCPLTVANIERQSNGVDCGLYVIKSAEIVMNNASTICGHCLGSIDDIRWLEGFFTDKVVLEAKKARACLWKELKDMSALAREQI